MCGVVGLMIAGSGPDAIEAVTRMVQRCHHRGPDSADEVCFALPDKSGHLALGHTRLSIIDLTERSNQPMRDEETGSWLAYNGEIYNYRDVRAELVAKGVRFHSSGDTEVVLRAMLMWGVDALLRLEGMFAFAFWNGQSSELLLARDPLGIKPMYYYHRTGTLLF